MGAIVYYLDDWYDVVRFVAFFVSLYSAGCLLVKYHRHHKTWNTKTKDYWFALLMWSFAGAEFCIQGIGLDRPFTPATVFLVAAILVTGKGVHQKGDWGNNAS